jgi:hypothetical protein
VNAGSDMVNHARAPEDAGRAPENDDEATVDPGRSSAKPFLISLLSNLLKIIMYLGCAGYFLNNKTIMNGMILTIECTK